MRDLLSIGRFSQLTGISVSALRFYADAGLLPPALIDPESGYRYYSPKQAPLAEKLRVLRSLDMPLDEVAALLAAPGADGARLLEQHEARLYRQHQEQQEALRTLGELLRGQRTLPKLDVGWRDWPAGAVLLVRGRAPAETFHALCQAAHAELRELADRHGAGVPDGGFELYPEGDTLGGPLAVEVCLPVAAPIPVAGRVRLAHFPRRRSVGAVHPGDWRTFGSSFLAVLAWLEERGQPAGEAYTQNLPDGRTELGFFTWRASP